MKNINFIRISVVLVLVITLVVSVGHFVKDNNRVSANVGGVKNSMQDSIKKILVSGSGVVGIKPDYANLSIGVNTIKKTSKEAQAENKKEMGQVIKALEMLKIDSVDIQTTSFDVHRVLDYSIENRERREKNAQFSVSNIVNVRIKNLDRAGEVIDAVSEVGANEIHSLEFKASDTDAKYNEALQLASKQAREKADAIAGALGVKIIGVASVRESVAKENDMSYEEKMQYDMSGVGGATEISKGELRVMARVHIEYEIE